MDSVMKKKSADEGAPRRNSYHLGQLAAAADKYRRAVQLYASTDLTYKQIAASEGVSARGLAEHIRKYHRGLLLRRNGIRECAQSESATLLRRERGQTLAGHLKYREAVLACLDEEHIGCSVSQIAAKFHLDAAALNHCLRLHYPEIVALRESERMRRGLCDNQPRGVRPRSLETYAAAVELLRTTDTTVARAAAECGVSCSGLRAHLSQYHKDVAALRAARRRAMKTDNKIEKSESARAAASGRRRTEDEK